LDPQEETHIITDLAHWESRPVPARVTLEGRYCRLEPLDARAHSNDLFEASMAPGAEERFRYLSEKPQDRKGFDRWIAQAAVSADRLFFGVIDRETRRCEGRQSYMRITPEHGVVEIGAILWGPKISRTRVATEALFLSVQHAFDTLGYRRVEWKCDSRNAPSHRAALRFGFTFEGVFRQHMVNKGHNRDTEWFSILDRDWPAIRNGFERWLAPENFDERGQQKSRLAALRT
jgi:RimJ/RimL family protein N-acetyltransferase